jgi:hypothetical protein
MSTSSQSYEKWKGKIFQEGSLIYLNIFSNIYATVGNLYPSSENTCGFRKNLETISICKENILPQDSNLWYE